MMVSFCAVLFPTRSLGCDLELESVSEGFTLIYRVDPDEVAHNEHVRNILRIFADVNFVVCLFSALIFRLSLHVFRIHIQQSDSTE